MAPKRSVGADSRPIQPVKTNGAAHNLPQTIGSGSKGGRDLYGFFPEKEPLPVGLSLRLDTPVEGVSEQLNQDTLLIRSPDPNFGYCWFSRPFDFGADRDNPAFWMLQKTARDKWVLCLRGSGGDMAAYHLKTTKHAFPITLKKDRASKEFANWPRSITVSWA
ncbi:MAG TPA: hypothetical protein VE999_23525 [Gemmataceae bacterium]|nr:hypothetical protein [Gemmataceae bacterium]